MTKRKKQSAAYWQEAAFALLDSTHDTLLQDIENSVEHQARRLQEIANASDREIKKALLAGLDHALKPVKVSQTRDDKAAGIYRDAQGRGWQIPKSVKAK